MRTYSFRPRLELLEDRLTPATHPLTSVPVLNSLPGATASLYLDFNGHYEAAYGSYTNINTPAFDLDGDKTTFNDSELAAIRSIWEYVAEDYAPFNLNVTTVQPPSFANGVALRVAIGGTGTWIGFTGGTGAVNCFINAVPNTVFVFAENQGGDVKAIGEIASHESGHGFGLQHQFSDPSNGRAPIMAGATNHPRDVWWYGTTTSGSLQDDMAMIARSQNGFGYRADDHGGTAGTATPLTVAGNLVSGSGIITTTADLDYYSFSTGAGQVTLTVSVPDYVMNLDARLELRSETGTLIASADPSTSFGATITANVAAGSYRLVVASHGLYGDVGQYTVYGTIASIGGTTVNAPSSLTAAPMSTTQISLSWTDNAINETAYLVDRSQDGISWTRIATLAANATSLADGTVSPGSTFTYRVCAQSGATLSGQSNTASATTVPLAPGSLTATAVTSSQINLAWSDVSGETSYKIERSTDGVNWTQVGTVSANIATYQSTGLNASTTYWFRVRGNNAGGDSAYSNLASAATAAAVTVPAAPGSLTAAAISSSQINLSWSDVAGETGYKVERSTDGISWAQIASTGAGVLSYQNTGLAGSTTYYYRVRAYNSAGDSGNSSQASATTAAAATPPAAPSNLAANLVFSGQVSLSWLDNSSNETGFIIQRSSNGGKSWTQVGQVGANVTTFTDTTANARKNYVYRVYAYNTSGNSSYSNVA